MGDLVVCQITHRAQTVFVSGPPNLSGAVLTVLGDTSDDEEDWTPQFLSVDTGYLPGQSHGTSTFISTSRLAAVCSSFSP